MTNPVFSSDYLTLRDSLAHPETCPDLSAAWDKILERAEKIEPRGLNELWEYYLERLYQCEKRSCDEADGVSGSR